MRNRLVSRKYVAFRKLQSKVEADCFDLFLAAPILEKAIAQR